MATLAAAAAHIRKRQYQPSISSHFRSAEPSSSDPSSQSLSSLSPPLPAETQASLLSVGMRVRKSVPEGYKTHKTLSTQGFSFPITAPYTASSRPPNVSKASQELAPFCGLHKVGGWAEQPMPSSSAPLAFSAGHAVHDEDGLPGLSMSQHTISSTQSSFVSTYPAPPAPNKKRSYEDEIEEDMDAYFDELESEDLVTIPSIYLIGHPTMTDLSSNTGSRRPMAKMKSALRRAATTRNVTIMSDGDFEEAAFLAPLEGMDVDQEG